MRSIGSGRGTNVNVENTPSVVRAGVEVQNGNHGVQGGYTAEFMDQMKKVFEASEQRHREQPSSSSQLQGTVFGSAEQMTPPSSTNVTGVTGHTVLVSKSLVAQRSNRFAVDGVGAPPTPHNSVARDYSSFVLRGEQPSSQEGGRDSAVMANSVDCTSSPLTQKDRVSSSPLSVTSSMPVPFKSTGDGTGSKDRRNFMRRQRVEYLRNQRCNAGKEEKVRVATDVYGNVTGLRTIFNRAIRDSAMKALDMTSKEFANHPAAAFAEIEQDIDSKFKFDPPLKEGYIKEYLKESLCWKKYEWKSYYFTFKRRHPQCPAKQYPALVVQWVAETTKEEAQCMCEMRLKRKSNQLNKKVACSEDAPPNTVRDHHADMDVSVHLLKLSSREKYHRAMCKLCVVHRKYVL